MSLRMNLFGWRQASFCQVLGSNDSAVLDTASAKLSEALPSEPEQSKAREWLRTLIERGFPLRQDREPPAVPADGGLLTVRMEAELHAVVVHCIARAIAREDDLDLALESSYWSHPAVGALHRELRSCGFTRSKACGASYFSWIEQLSRGSPLFGDDFRTEWTYYTRFSNQDLATMISVFQAAADFQMPLPEDYPEALAKNVETGLSDSGRAFIGDLIDWFDRIQRAGQDALIVWW